MYNFSIHDNILCFYALFAYTHLKTEGKKMLPSLIDHVTGSTVIDIQL